MRTPAGQSLSLVSHIAGQVLRTSRSQSLLTLGASHRDTYPQPCGICRTSKLIELGLIIKRTMNLRHLHGYMGCIRIHRPDPDRIASWSSGIEDGREVCSHNERVQGGKCKIILLRRSLVHVISASVCCHSKRNSEACALTLDRGWDQRCSPIRKHDRSHFRQYYL